MRFAFESPDHGLLACFLTLKVIPLLRVVVTLLVQLLENGRRHEPKAAWDAGVHHRGAKLPFGLVVGWGWQGSRPIDVLLECQGISARVTCSPKMLDGGILLEDLPYCLSLPFLCVTPGKCSHYVNSR